MSKLINALFGCPHSHCTLPITVPRSRKPDAKDVAERRNTYIVCLDCGKEFPYDWEQMKVVPSTSRVA
jgi:translation initiation factor 2 beta subunit (eIF-2beta)/eIF-5